MTQQMKRRNLRSTMKTVAYCRYSTDLQSATSISDQARVCRARAEALGLRVDDVYADEQISGATPILARPSGMRLHAEALAGRIAVILIESLDRLSRDLVEQETVVRRLEHRGVRLIAVDGYDSNDGELRALTRGVKGLMSEHFLHDLRRKTHRGLVVSTGAQISSVIGIENSPPGFRPRPLPNGPGRP